MPQPMDPKLSEASESNLEDDAELDLTLIDECNQPEKLKIPQPEPAPVLDSSSSDKSGIEASSDDKLRKVLLRVQAQRQVMLEKEARKRQMGRADLSDSSLCSTLSSESANESMSSEDSTVEIEVEKVLEVRGRTMRAVMMSSHNVSSVNDELVQLEDDEERMRGVAVISQRVSRRKVARSSITTASVDLSHASRDPVVAAPKDILNKNEMKLALEYRQRQME